MNEVDDAIISMAHQLHYTYCNCLGDAAECCDEGCPCHKILKGRSMASIGEAVVKMRQQFPDLCLRPNADFSVVCLNALGHSGRCAWEQNEALKELLESDPPRRD